MPLTENDLATVANGDVVNAAGEKIGGVGQFYLDDQTGEPTWVTVKTGLFGTSESFVPLAGANIRGSNVEVNYDKDTIKDAPRIDADGHLDPDEEQRLYDYYGLDSGGYAGRERVTTTGGAADLGADDRGADLGADDRGADLGADDRGADLGADDRLTGRDRTDRSTDDAMTLSEEQLRVGTERRETGRARLRKYVVTENVTQTVPVTREEVRIEREPITDANVDEATSGPEISEAEHEVVLHEERPVVQKDTVPVERVRLDTETVTDEATISEEVRKEKLDTDVDDNTSR